MSLSIELEVQEKLKRVAKKRDISVSRLIRSLVEKFLNEEEDCDMIVFKLPKHLKNNTEELTNWFNARIKAVIARCQN